MADSDINDLPVETKEDTAPRDNVSTQLNDPGERRLSAEMELKRVQESSGQDLPTFELTGQMQPGDSPRNNPLQSKETQTIDISSLTGMRASDVLGDDSDTPVDASNRKTFQAKETQTLDLRALAGTGDSTVLPSDQKKDDGQSEDPESMFKRLLDEIDDDGPPELAKDAATGEVPKWGGESGFNPPVEGLFNPVLTPPELKTDGEMPKWEGERSYTPPAGDTVNPVLEPPPSGKPNEMPKWEGESGFNPPADRMVNPVLTPPELKTSGELPSDKDFGIKAQTHGMDIPKAAEPPLEPIKPIGGDVKQTEYGVKAQTQGMDIPKAPEPPLEPIKPIGGDVKQTEYGIKAQTHGMDLPTSGEKDLGRPDIHNLKPTEGQTDALGDALKALKNIADGNLDLRTLLSDSDQMKALYDVYDGLRRYFDQGTIGDTGIQPTGDTKTTPAAADVSSSTRDVREGIPTGKTDVLEPIVVREEPSLGRNGDTGGHIESSGRDVLDGRWVRDDASRLRTGDTQAPDRIADDPLARKLIGPNNELPILEPRSWDAEPRPWDQRPGSRIEDWEKHVESDHQKSEQADKAIDARVDDPSRNLSQNERDLLKGFEQAIVHGDDKALRELMGQYKDHPEQLDNVMQELKKDLAGAGVDVNYKDGTLQLHYESYGSRAQSHLETSGNPTVLDGRMVITPSTLVQNKQDYSVSVEGKSQGKLDDPLSYTNTSSTIADRFRDHLTTDSAVKLVDLDLGRSSNEPHSRLEFAYSQLAQGKTPEAQPQRMESKAEDVGKQAAPERAMDHTDPKTGTSFKYDSSGHLVEIRSKDGGTTNLTYEGGSDKPASFEIKNSEGKVLAYGKHDPNVELSVNPETGAVKQNVKLPEGRLESEFAPDGKTSTTRFDKAGHRLESTVGTQTGDGNQKPIEHTVYTYRGQDGKPATSPDKIDDSKPVTSMKVDGQGRVVEASQFADVQHAKDGKPSMQEKISYSEDTAKHTQSEHHEVFDAGDDKPVVTVDKTTDTATGSTTLDTTMGNGIKQHMSFDKNGVATEFSRQEGGHQLEFALKDGRVQGVKSDGKEITGPEAADIKMRGQLALEMSRQQWNVHAPEARHSLEDFKPTPPREGTTPSGTLVFKEGTTFQQLQVENGQVKDKEGKVIGSVQDNGNVTVNGKTFNIAQTEGAAFHGIGTDKGRLDLVSEGDSKGLNGVFHSPDGKESFAVVGGNLYNQNGQFAGHINPDGSLQTGKFESIQGMNSFKEGWKFEGSENGKPRQFETTPDMAGGKMFIPDAAGKPVEYEVKNGMVINKATGEQYGTFKPPHETADGRLEGGSIVRGTPPNQTETPLENMKGAVFDVHLEGQTGIQGRNLQGICLGPQERQADGSPKKGADGGMVNVAADVHTLAHRGTDFIEARDSYTKGTHGIDKMSGAYQEKVDGWNRQFSDTQNKQSELNKMLQTGQVDTQRAHELDMAAHRAKDDHEGRDRNDDIKEKKRQLDDPARKLEDLPSDTKTINGRVTVPCDPKEDPSGKMTLTIRDGQIIDKDGKTVVGHLDSADGKMTLINPKTGQEAHLEMKDIRGAAWHLEYKNAEGAQQKVDWVSLGQNGIVSLNQLKEQARAETQYAKMIADKSDAASATNAYVQTDQRERMFDVRLDSIARNGVDPSKGDLDFLAKGPRDAVRDNAYKDKPEPVPPTLEIPKLATAEDCKTANGKLRLGSEVYDIKNGDLYRVHLESGKPVTDEKPCGKLGPGYNVAIEGRPPVNLANENRVVMELAVGSNQELKHQIVSLGPGRIGQDGSPISGGLVDVAELRRQANESMRQAEKGNKDYFENRPYITGGLANWAMGDREAILKDFADRTKTNIGHFADETNTLFEKAFTDPNLSNNSIDGSIKVSQMLLKESGSQAASANELAEEGKQMQKLVADSVVMAATTVATAGAGALFSAAVSAGKIGVVAAYAGEVAVGAAMGGGLSVAGRASDKSNWKDNLASGALEGGAMAFGSVLGKGLGQIGKLAEVEAAAAKVTKAGTSVEQALKAGLITAAEAEQLGTAVGQMAMKGYSETAIRAMYYGVKGADSVVQTTAMTAAGSIREHNWDAFTAKNIALGSAWNLAGQAGGELLGRAAGKLGAAEDGIARAMISDTSNAYVNASLGAMTQAVDQERARIAAELHIPKDMVTDKILEERMSWSNIAHTMNEAGFTGAATAPFMTAASHGIGHAVKAATDKPAGPRGEAPAPQEQRPGARPESESPLARTADTQEAVPARGERTAEKPAAPETTASSEKVASREESGIGAREGRALHSEGEARKFKETFGDNVSPQVNGEKAAEFNTRAREVTEGWEVNAGKVAEKYDAATASNRELKDATRNWETAFDQHIKDKVPADQADVLKHSPEKLRKLAESNPELAKALRENEGPLSRYDDARSDHANNLKELNRIAKEREGELQKLMDQYAKDNGLPGIKIKVREDITGGYGYINAETGVLALKRADVLGARDPSKLIQTLYHEFTHNEQQSLVVRQMAQDFEKGHGKLPELPKNPTPEQVAAHERALEPLAKAYSEKMGGQKVTTERLAEILGAAPRDSDGKVTLTQAESERASILAKSLKENINPAAQLEPIGNSYRRTEGELQALKGNSKDGAEKLLEKASNDPALMKHLFGDPPPQTVTDLINSYKNDRDFSYNEGGAQRVLKELMEQRLTDLRTKAEGIDANYRGLPHELEARAAEQKVQQEQDFRKKAGDTGGLEKAEDAPREYKPGDVRDDHGRKERHEDWAKPKKITGEEATAETRKFDPAQIDGRSYSAEEGGRRVPSEREATGHVEKDANGSPEKIIDPSGHEYKVGRDKSGEINEVTSQGESFKKDASGNWERETNGKRERLQEFEVKEDGSIRYKTQDNEEFTRRTDGSLEKTDANGRKTLEGVNPQAEKAKIERLAERIENPKQREAMQQHMDAFERRAREQNMSPEEVAKTYHHLSELMTAEKCQAPLKDRMILADQILKNASEPTSIRQGQHNTCQVGAGVEVGMFSRHPAEAARVISEAVRTGEVVTADGSHIKLRSADLRMDAQTREEHLKFDSHDGRNYADKVMQIVAVNTEWQTSTKGPMGEPIERGSVRYEQHRPEGPTDTGERLINAHTGEELSRHPALEASKLEDIYYQLSGKKERFVIANSDGPDTLQPKDAGQKFKTEADFIAKLNEMNPSEKNPLVIGVNCNAEPFYRDSGAGTAGGSGGNHFVSITGVERGPNGEIVKVYVDNQWGPGAEHTKGSKQGGIPVKDLYLATCKPDSPTRIEALHAEAANDPLKALEYARAAHERYLKQTDDVAKTYLDESLSPTEQQALYDKQLAKMRQKEGIKIIDEDGYRQKLNEIIDRTEPDSYTRKAAEAALRNLGEPKPEGAAIEHGSAPERGADRNRPRDAGDRSPESKLPYTPDAEQRALQDGRVELLQKRARSGNNSSVEAYMCKVTMPDGSVVEARFRPTDHEGHDISAARFRKEAAAYKLNKELGFDNGFPVTVPKEMEINGEMRRGYLQIEKGSTLEHGVPDIANNPALKNQFEQAILERMILGDSDDHGGNVVLVSEGKGQTKVRNIDLDFGLPPNKIPDHGSSPGGEDAYREFVRENFLGKEISPANREKIHQFAERYDTPQGRDDLAKMGLKPDEIDGLLSRARWLDEHGTFPPHKTFRERLAEEGARRKLEKEQEAAKAKEAEKREEPGRLRKWYQWAKGLISD